MEKEIIQLFSKFGIDIKNIDTEMARIKPIEKKRLFGGGWM